MATKPDTDALLGDTTTPVVFITTPPGAYYTLNIDTYRSSYDMSKRLFDLGHRDIAFAMAKRHTWDQEQRLKGVVDAIQSLGLSLNEHWIADHLRFRDIPEWTANLLNSHPSPTALFVGSSSHSDAIFAELMKHNIIFPNDLSYVGYGHAFTYSHYDIIRQPTLQLGVEAVRLLRQATARPGLPTLNKALQAEFFSVGTLGPPPTAQHM